MHTKNLRRGLAAAFLTATAAIAVLGSADASYAGPTASPTSSSTGTKSSESPEERVVALVEPSLVHLSFTWRGYIHDLDNNVCGADGRSSCWFKGAGTNDGAPAEPFYETFDCTGFVVGSQGYIATAGHCADPKETIPYFLQQGAQWAVDHHYYSNSALTVSQVAAFNLRVEGQQSTRKPDLVSLTVTPTGTDGAADDHDSMGASVVGFRSFQKSDVAVLKVKATDLLPLPLATQDPKVGQTVDSIGFPGNVQDVTDGEATLSFRPGRISSIGTEDAGGILPVYEVSSTVSPGMSGGPTVTMDGAVVGVNSFYSGTAPTADFVRPARQLRPLLGGVDTAATQVSKDYRAGLTAYWNGDKRSATNHLRAVLAAQPDNAFAQQYLAKARSLPDPPAPSRHHGAVRPITLAVAALLLVLLLGAVAAVVVTALRRRAGRPAAGIPTATGGRATPGANGASGYAADGRAPAPAAASFHHPASSGVNGTAAPVGGVATRVRDQQRTVVAVRPGRSFCTTCGTALAPTARFCGSCGTPSA